MTGNNDIILNFVKYQSYGVSHWIVNAHWTYRVSITKIIIHEQLSRFLYWHSVMPPESTRICQETVLSESFCWVDKNGLREISSLSPQTLQLSGTRALQRLLGSSPDVRINSRNSAWSFKQIKELPANCERFLNPLGLEARTDHSSLCQDWK